MALTTLERVLLRLGEVDGQDDLLNDIIDTAEARMSLLYLDGEEVPPELEHVVVELTVIRYNRIASEGFSSQSIEGTSVSYTDSDFSAFRKDIDAYLRSKGKRGRLRFL